MRQIDPKDKALGELAALAGVDTRGLASVADLVAMDAGTVLIEQGHLNRFAYVVTRGQLVVEKFGQQVNVLGRGDIVGEITAVEVGLATATVRALTDAEAYAIDHRSLRAIAAQSPQFADRLRSLVDERTRIEPAA